MNFEGKNELIQGEQEISLEQKKSLGGIWADMIIDDSCILQNISELEPEEFKKELYRKTIEDIDNLIIEWNLQADPKLIESIQKTENIDSKAALELEYIKKEHAQVDDVAQKFDRLSEKSTKWDSWPKKMRESKGFNCVGATLLGMSLLDKGGIKSYYGTPHGHAVNIAKLSNGDWWYVDFRNGKQNVIKINPEEITLDSVPVLKINNPDIAYRFIPIHDNSEIVGSILGNLASLKQEAEDQDTSNETIEKKEAKEYLNKYKQNFREVDFSSLLQSLCPNLVKVEETEEMKNEKRRIDMIMNLEKPFQDYLKTLSKEKVRNIFEEAKKQKEAIENLFRKDDTSVFLNISSELKKALEVLLESLKLIKEKPEIYQENIDIIVNKMIKLE
ncbi:MAG: hypothetical protein WC319_11610 [Candidatus Paceibacterota bacterium]|jgi:hypothetical protein